MFFDGSGKSEDPQCRFLTLAGVLAVEPVWKEWSEKWKRILDEYGVEYCHMKELFLKDKGPFQAWNHERKRKFVLALLQSLNYAERMKMICTSLTIDLTAYRRLAVRKDIKPPEAVCLDFCISHLFAHPEFGNETAEVFFDSSESFEKHLQYNWTRYKSDPSSWASDLRIVRPPKNALPVQAADLLAWAANRRYTAEEDWTSTWRYLLDMSFITLPRYHAIYGEPELVNHPGFYGWPNGKIVPDE
jgi:hypothetical protein